MEKEYTFEDMEGRSDEEVTKMLKHNKRLKGIEEEYTPIVEITPQWLEEMKKNIR
jgi:hypothetical protein